MNKIYFNIDASKCGYPLFNTPIVKYNMQLSTIVHNYLSYRLKLNNNVRLNGKGFRKHLINAIVKSRNFLGTRNCSYVLKALIVSMIQNQNHGFAAYHILGSKRTAIVDSLTNEVYLNGITPTGKYKYFFQILNSSHNNFFDIKILDPNYLISDEEIKSVIKDNQFNYSSNLEALKNNPVSISTNEYDINICFDENEKEEKEFLENIEVYSKNHLKIVIKEKLDGIEFRDDYVESKYNIYLPKFYVFNTWSGSLVQLDEHKFSQLKNNTLENFTTEEIEDLKYLGFITNIKDEFGAVKLQNQNYIKNDKKFSIVIAPTTKCNAQCSYCFEKGIKAVEMDDDTVIHLVDYIEKASKGRSVHITWFGGEPLMGAKQIDKICELLDSRNINYNSSMISNGYLIDKYIKNAKDKWKLQRIQITLDDLFEKYDVIKRIGIHSFEKVISNIHLLIENEIKVSIRVNFDAANYTKSLKLIDYVKDEFGDKVSLYFHDIVGAEYKSANEMQPNPMIEISKKLMDAGYINGLPDLKIKRSMTPCGLEKTNFINVFPDGSATRCEHYIGKESEYSAGNLNFSSFNPKPYEKILYKGCKYCVCYPICGGGCESNHKIRNGYGCTRIKTGLIELLKLYIERRIENENSNDKF